jgi:hypothetical protein
MYLALHSKCCVSILEPVGGTLVRYAKIKWFARISGVRSMIINVQYWHKMKFLACPKR